MTTLNLCKRGAGSMRTLSVYCPSAPSPPFITVVCETAVCLETFLLCPLAWCYGLSVEDAGENTAGGGRNSVFLVPARFSPPALWHSACVRACSVAYQPLGFSSFPQVALAASPSGTPTGSFLVDFVGTLGGWGAVPACWANPLHFYRPEGLPHTLSRVVWISAGGGERTVLCPRGHGALCLVSPS